MYVNNRDGDVLGSEPLVGLRNFNTDGNLYLTGSLGDALEDMLIGDLNDMSNNLLHRGGDTVTYGLPNGERNFTALNGFYVVGALDCVLDNPLVAQEMSRKRQHKRRPTCLRRIHWTLQMNQCSW